jgi:hypothetical protein
MFIPPICLAKRLNSSPSMIPRIKPKTAKIKGITISAAKAKSVPQLKPGVSIVIGERI